MEEIEEKDDVPPAPISFADRLLASSGGGGGGGGGPGGLALKGAGVKRFYSQISQSASQLLDEESLGSKLYLFTFQVAARLGEKSPDPFIQADLVRGDKKLTFNRLTTDLQSSYLSVEREFHNQAKDFLKGRGFDLKTDVLNKPQDEFYDLMIQLTADTITVWRTKRAHRQFSTLYDNTILDSELTTRYLIYQAMLKRWEV